MPSYKNDPIIVRTTTPSGSENYNGGIYGESHLFNGVRGVTYAPGHEAVVGVSENHTPSRSGNLNRFRNLCQQLRRRNSSR